MFNTYHAALQWAARGFPVFPCYPGRKEPLLSWKEVATTDPTTIERWFNNDEGYNIGYKLGNGKLLIDVDVKRSSIGFTSLHNLGVFSLADTLLISTPSGGLHAIYAHEDVSQSPPAPGIDIRSNGGYALAPGSWYFLRLSDGELIWPEDIGNYQLHEYCVKFYTISLDQPIAPLSFALKPRIKPKSLLKQSDLPSLVGENLTLAMQEAAEYVKHYAPVAVQGNHGDTTTYQLAATLTRDFGLSEQMAFDLMTGPIGEVPSWNDRCLPPWDHSELKAKIANGLAYGKRQRGAGTSIAIFGNTKGATNGDAIGPEFAPYRMEEEGPAAVPVPVQDSEYGLNLPKPDHIEVIMACDMIGQHIEPIWPQHLYRGMPSLLGGAPSGGKSQLAIDIAARITRGDEWPDGSGRAPRGKVLILSAEDHSFATIWPRLLAADADLARAGVLRSVKKMDGRRRAFNLQTDLDLLTQEVKKLNGPRPEDKVIMVIIDPVSAYLGKVEGNSNTDIRGVWNPMNDWGQENNICILAIEHLNKNTNNADTMGRFLGSIATVANSRSAFIVTPEDPDDKDAGMAFIPVKNNLDELPPTKIYQIKPMSMATALSLMPFKTSRVNWRLDKTSELNSRNASESKERRQTKINTAMDFILGMVRDGPQQVQRVHLEAAARGISKLSMDRAAQRLIDLGKLKSIRRGYGAESLWCLPEHAHQPPSTN